MKKIFLITVLLSFFGMNSPLQAAPEVGKPAPDFTLKDSNGKAHSLKDFKGKMVVLEWTNYDCPFVKKFYEPGKMQKFQKEYTAKGVVWLSICSSAPGKQGNFPPEEINRRKKESGAHPTAYLIDEKGEVGRLYSAKTTPHMFVVDPKGVLVYMGAIDTIASTKSEDISKAKNLVRAALDAVLAGQQPAVASSKPYGCSVKY